ncbi:MAG: DUF4102 domain-containing protein [Sphingopyxis sp.]|nr:DUF4102 domain-containing protein [Sphingopyxis sp.]
MGTIYPSHDALGRPTGAKLWRFKYRYPGKDNRIVLGAYSEVRLAEARQLREAARRKLRDGIDPSAVRIGEQVGAHLRPPSSLSDSNLLPESGWPLSSDEQRRHQECASAKSRAARTAATCARTQSSGVVRGLSG